MLLSLCTPQPQTPSRCGMCLPAAYSLRGTVLLRAPWTLEIGVFRLPKGHWWPPPWPAAATCPFPHFCFCCHHPSDLSSGFEWLLSGDLSLTPDCPGGLEFQSWKSSLTFLCHVTQAPRHLCSREWALEPLCVQASGMTFLSLA